MNSRIPKTEIKRATFNLPEDAKIGIQELSVRLLKDGLCDGTLHNTMLYMLAHEHGLRFNYIPPRKVSRNSILLHIPEDMHSLLRWLYEKSEAPDFKSYLSASLQRGLEKLLQQHTYEELVQTSTAVSRALTLSERKSDRLVIESLMINGKEYKLYKPSSYQEFGYQSKSTAYYHMSTGILQVVEINGSEFVAVPIEMEEPAYRMM
ncbi:MAG: hypothetical protein M3Q97_01400 [Bacteroidota bacterium]|nr:hypothetical protein [Bacteroidota bacterium]